MYNNFDNTFFAAFGMLIFLFLAIAILVAVFYLLNLQNLLKEIDSKNRLVEPGNVWLMFIPIFNIIYPFILYPKICDSVRNEYESRGIRKAGDYSRGIGIAMPILTLCGYVPIIGGLAGLANFVLFIVFWVKTAEYKNELKRSSRAADGISSSSDLLD